MSEPHIRRLDRQAKGTHGWEVVVSRAETRSTRLFSDRTHGGRDAALAAAVRWRDTQEWYNPAHRGARADARGIASGCDFVYAALLEHAMRMSEAGEDGVPAPKEPYIYRLRDAASCAVGWIVRTHRHGKQSSKIFKDADWDDEELALSAARAWRDRDAAVTPAPRFKPLTGARVDELRRQEKQELGDGRKGRFAFWVAAWTDVKGVRWERKFSVNFWGEDAARQKAEAVHAHFLQIVEAARRPR